MNWRKLVQIHGITVSGENGFYTASTPGGSFNGGRTPEEAVFSLVKLKRLKGWREIIAEAMEEEAV